MELRAVERRLTTILSADVVGYSRLMGEDEARTMAALKAHRKELIEPKVARYHGRIVKRMGEKEFLAKFPNAMEAVPCAIEIQRAMAEWNADVPEGHQTQFRMFCTGLDCRLVLVKGNDITVPIPLDEIIDPGGICVCTGVRMQILGKIDVGLQFLKKGEFTNIEGVVHIIALVFDGTPRSNYPLFRDPPK